MERWGLALVARCGDSLLSVRLGRTDGVGTVVSPLKAPSSAGKTAARKSESAAPPAAPGPSEFAASLQGIFAVLDAPVRFREDVAARPEPAERGTSVSARLPETAERQPGAAGREAAPRDPGPAGGPASAPAIERALGALDEIRRREGLQPAPEGRTAPQAGSSEPPASAAPEEAGETPPEFKDIEILEVETPGLAELEAAEAPAVKGTAPAPPVFAAVSAGFEAPPAAVEGEPEENSGATLGIPAASGARNSSSKPGIRGAEPATPAETVDRIVQAAQLLKTRGATRLRLRLNPPNLGGLRVDLSVRQGVLQGKIQAENPAARDLLVAQLDRLKAALEAQGLQVGEFQVGVDQSFQQASGDSSWTGGSFGSGKRGLSGEAGDTAAAPETPVRRPADPRIFDVTI